MKQHFIAFTYIAEMLLFILIGMMDWSIDAGRNYFWAMGGLYLFGFVFVILCLPETRRTSLREAQNKFKRFINTAF